MTTLAEVYDRDFAQRAERKRSAGIGLLVIAGGIWLWLAYQLLVPFTIDYGSSSTRDCDSRVFYGGDSGRNGAHSYADAEGRRCDAEREWAGLLAMLVISMPFAAVGAFHYTSGTVSLDMTRYAAEKARLEAVPDN